MCLGLPTQFNRAFFRRYLDGPLRLPHLALLQGYFRWGRIVTTAPTLDGIPIAGCAIDVCDCRLAEGVCRDRVDVCYKLDRKGKAPYDRQAMSDEMLRQGRARLYILNVGHRWELCHCCTCCCLILAVVAMCGEPFIHPSGLRPAPTGTACAHCGACVEACPLGVRAVDGLTAPDRCIGCGVCTAVCPQEAWRMTRAAPAPALRSPPRWWAYTFSALYTGYLNLLLLAYALLPAARQA